MIDLPVHRSGRSQKEGCGQTDTFRIETWGCQMNVLDGQRMAGQLEALGLRSAYEGEDSDVVLLNTCSVREKAQAKVYSALGVLSRRKRERPQMVIGVAGCMAQIKGDEILERAPWVDFAVGTGQVERVGELVNLARQQRRQVLAVELPEDSPAYAFRKIRRDSAFQAYVTVVEGCDQFCTFCIVPFTRGRERSRRSGEILQEVELLAARGYTEVTLLGQTVNAYRDPEEGIGLGQLLMRVGGVAGVARLRFLTSHPAFVDQEMIEALAAGGNISPYLHLPAQSGSDRMLYRMKRRYNRDGYQQTIDRIRRALPEIAISSDFIVGFPGETEEDFLETLDLVRRVRFASLFAFRYSPRPGTAAARWGSDSQVPDEIAGHRLARLLALQETLQAETNRGLEGREMEILVEDIDRKGHPTGRTSCNRVVHVEGTLRPVAPGTYLPVRVTKGFPNSLLARPAAA